jgi:hypothetical protein
MKQHYIVTLEIIVDDEDTEFSHPIISPLSNQIFNHKFKIDGIIKITHERQKQRPSYKVMEGTLKRHVRELYDDIIKPRPDGN